MGLIAIIHVLLVIHHAVGVLLPQLIVSIVQLEIIGKLGRMPVEVVHRDTTEITLLFFALSVPLAVLPALQHQCARPVSKLRG